MGLSGEVKPGRVATRRLGRQDVVLWRTAQGALHANRPYCPHLGAHLGVGGTVQGAPRRLPHLGGDAAVQLLGFDDPFAGLQVPTHPNQRQRSDTRGLIVVLHHRATSSSGRRHGRRNFQVSMAVRLNPPASLGPDAGARQGAGQKSVGRDRQTLGISLNPWNRSSGHRLGVTRHLARRSDPVFEPPSSPRLVGGVTPPSSRWLAVSRSGP
ncbi:Rieske 2Fe-2S domain-containing protein [Streptomyces sp. NPDC059755]|uniref:Rieske 2Fe-2S domain-containing protein n=1 Tax=Streptomyces sp. NPDC059755 TaxID=3346934 RepID=UPI0036478B7C